MSAEEADTIDVIDVAARKQVASIKVGKRPRGIGFTPDGKFAYTACELADKVYAIEVATNKVVAEIPAGLRVNGVTVHPDGKTVFVTNGGDGNVMVDRRCNQQSHQDHSGW